MFQRHSLAVLLVAALALSSGSALGPGQLAEASLPGSDGSLAWSTERANAQRTGLSTATGPDQPAVIWSVGFMAPFGEPVAGPGRRVYGRGSVGLYAYRADGSREWWRGTGSGATPAVAPGGRVYVGLTESPAPRVGYSRFVALRPDGTTLWRRAMGKNTGPSSPAIAADGVLFVTQKWGLLAVSPSGEVLWRRHALVGKPHLDSMAPSTSSDGTPGTTIAWLRSRREALRSGPPQSRSPVRVGPWSWEPTAQFTAVQFSGSWRSRPTETCNGPSACPSGCRRWAPTAPYML